MLFNKPKAPIADRAQVAATCKVRLDAAIADAQRVMSARVLATWLEDRAEAIRVQDAITRPLF